MKLGIMLRSIAGKARNSKYSSHWNFQQGRMFSRLKIATWKFHACQHSLIPENFRHPV